MTTITDLKGTIHYVSGSVKDILGYSPEEIMGKNALRFIHPNDRKRALQALAFSVGHPLMPVALEARFIHKNGTWRVLGTIGKYFPKGKDGGREGDIMLSSRDVTETNKAHDELNMLHLGIERSPEAIIVTDPKGIITYVNPFFERTYGYTRKEAIGKNPRLISSGLQSKKFYETFWKTIISKRIFTGEMRNRAKDGRIIIMDVSVNPILDERGNIKGFMGIQKDVTERKSAEEAFQSKTALLEAQTNTSMDGILIVDQGGNTVLQNQRCIDLWKIPKEIVMSKDDKRQLAFVKNRTKDPNKFVEKVIYLYAHPYEVSHDEVEFKDGMTLERYSAPVLGKDGKNYGRIWIFHDITERTKAEAKLKESQNDLIRHIQDLERFQNVSVDRELKMIELKRLVRDLERKLQGQTGKKGQVDRRQSHVNETKR